MTNTKNRGLVGERLELLNKADFAVIRFNEARADKESLLQWALEPQNRPLRADDVGTVPFSLGNAAWDLILGMRV